MRYFILYDENLKNSDPDGGVYEMAYEALEAGSCFGPGVREEYCLHYIISGHGTFNGMYLGPGDAFLVKPKLVYHYYPDENDPWCYLWVSLWGKKSEIILSEGGFDTNATTFKFDYISDIKAMCQYLSSISYDKINKRDFIEGCFKQLSSYNRQNQYVVSTDIKKHHVRRALVYISQNYYKNIKVSDVSDFLALNSQYLYNIFKETVGISPKNYIISYRIDKAKDLLKIPSLSVGDVARSVGYSDVFAFSKIFKKNVGRSPDQFRKENKH